MKRIRLLLMFGLISAFLISAIESAYYPDEPPLEIERLDKTGETFYKAYILGGSDDLIFDMKNGIAITKALQCDGTSFTTTEGDILQAALGEDKIERRKLLTNGIKSTDPSAGLLCNLNVGDIVHKSRYSVNLYLWVFNLGQDVRTITYNGCTTSEDCIALQANMPLNVQTQISGGSTFQANEYMKVETIQLKKNTDTSVEITINASTTSIVYLDSTNVYVRITFNSPNANIYLSYLQVNIVAINQLYLSPKGSCDNNSDCFPGIACLYPASSCIGPKNPSCAEPDPGGYQSSLRVEDCGTYCSKIAKSLTQYQSSCNPLTHVDVTQLSGSFYQSTIPYIQKKLSNAYSMGLWLFINNISAFGTKMVNFVMSSLMMISLGSPDNNTAIAYCTPYNGLYPSLETQTARASMEDNFTNKEYMALGKHVLDTYTNNRWFYVRCGFNLDSRQLYVMMTNKKFTDPYSGYYTIKNIPNVSYYSNTSFEFPFKNIASTTYFIVKGAATLVNMTRIFLRQLTVFTDYLPYSLNFPVQYYDFTNLSKNLAFKSLWIYGFELDSTSNATITVYYYDQNYLKQNSKVIFSFSYSASFAVPAEFYRLNLLEINKSFSDSSLLTQVAFTCPNIEQICWKDGTPLSCTSGSSYDLTAVNDSAVCVSSCPLNTMPQLGSSFISSVSAFCNFPCGTDINNVQCPTEKAPFRYYSDKNNFLCDSSKELTKINWDCVNKADEEKGALFFSRRIGTGVSIKFPIASLTNYSIEFWMLLDQPFAPSQSGINRNFIWYTTGLKIAKSNVPTSKAFYLYSTAGGNALNYSSFDYAFGQWHRVLYSVTTTSVSTLMFYYPGLATPFSTTITGSTALTLTYILFCNAVNCPCNNKLCTSTSSAINWSSAFYRNIKVWSDNRISNAFFNEYDKYYKLFSKTAPRFSGLMYFFPLNFNHMKNFEITDPDRPLNKAGFEYYNIETQNSPFPVYQYSLSFDIHFTGSGQVVLSTISTDVYTASLASCTISNCYYCNNIDCLECIEGYVLYKGQCTQNAYQKNYLKSPTFVNGIAKDLTFVDLFTDTPTKFSVSFFFKMLGYVDITPLTSYDIMRFGPNFKIVYQISSKQIQLVNGSTVFGECNYSLGYLKWKNISVSYYNDSTMSSYYPAMMNFQVDMVNILLSGPYDGLTVTTITIPKESIGIYGKIWVWKDYITGPWSAMVNLGMPDTTFLKIANDATSSSCIQESQLIDGARADACAFDFGEMDDVLNEDKWCSTVASFADSSGCQQADSSCKYGYYSIMNSQNLCGCATSNTVTDNMIWKSSTTNHYYCGMLDFHDFGQYSFITLSNVKSAATEYTIEFWVYIQTYVSGQFGEYHIIWDNQLKISLATSGGSLKSTCYPVYTSINPQLYTQNEEIDYPREIQWVYIRCSVDKSQQVFFHFHHLYTTSEKTLISTGPTVNEDTLTTLSFNNQSVNRGIIFFRQIRLWSCYFCQTPYTYKIELTKDNVGQYPSLLHLWDPVTVSGSSTVEDIVGGIFMNTLTVDPSWVGYNILDNFKYIFLSTSNLLLASELAADNKLPKLNEVEDVEITVDPSRFSRYTIELWATIASVSNLSQGVHVRWKNLISLSFIQGQEDNSTLKAYCWPQDYKMSLDNTFGTRNINALAASTLNYDVVAYSPYVDKTWIWIRCAVSFNSNKFYLNTNSKKDLQEDILWYGQKTDIPFRHFWKIGETTHLLISGAKLNSSVDIYIRHIYLFNDYLPQDYDFKHVDMTQFTSAHIPSFIFSLSFLNYIPNLSSYVYNAQTKKKFIYIIPAVEELSYDNTIVPEIMCAPGQKFDSGSSTCLTITNCAEDTVFASYCVDESTALVCNPSYYWGKAACTNDCSANFMRSPNSSTTFAFCNNPCAANVLNCPSTKDDLLNLNNSFTCNKNYVNYGYKCIEEGISKQKAFLYFNGCQNFLPFSGSFSIDSKLSQGYLISFWIKLDRYNENCSHVGKRKFYFVLEPHSIYLDEVITTYAQNSNPLPGGFYNVVYEYIFDPTIKATLLSFSQWNWNYISIHVNKQTEFLKVYSNYHFISPDLSISTAKKNLDLDLKKLLFCSNGGIECTSTSSLGDLSWGAAFYKHLKIIDGVNGNPWLALESELQTYDDNLAIDYYDFPFNLKSTVCNRILNLIQGDDISVTSDYSSECDILINYSSNFDYNLYHPGRYVSSINLDAGFLTDGICTSNCLKCTSDEFNACLECDTGFKLNEGECKNYSGYFLKMPIVNFPNKILSLKVNNTEKKFDLQMNPIFTWTIWMKYFGQLATSISACPPIIRFSSDGKRYLCYSSKELLIIYYETDIRLYQDTTFYSSIGEWVLLSFSVNLSYYPKYSRFYVNDKQIASQQNISILSSVVIFDRFDIGNEISALFTDLRFYRSFIVNPYGYVLGPNKAVELFYFIPLISSTNTGVSTCIEDENLNQSVYEGIQLDTESSYVEKLGISCVPDYHPLKTSCRTVYEFIDKKQLMATGNLCASCPGDCPIGCAYNDITNPQYGCVCNTYNNWIQFDKTSDMLYCRKIPHYEFSKGTTIAQTKVANKGEYSTEFWFYIYSYNKEQVAFDSLEVIWDLHNYIKIYNPGNNSLSAHCSPVYDHSKRSTFIGKEVDTTNSVINDQLQGVNDYGFDDSYSSESYFKWVYVQCSTNIPRNLFNMNSKPTIKIQFTSDNFPNLLATNVSKLIMQPGYQASVNFGLFFIRELKLWSQWDIRQFTSNCVNAIDMNRIFQPRLLNYFRITEGDTFSDYFSSSTIGEMTMSLSFLGYNVMEDVTNEALIFPLLATCSSLTVLPAVIYNKQTSIIISVSQISGSSLLKCSYRVNETDEMQVITVYANSKKTSYMFAFTDEYFGDKEELEIELYCDILFDYLGTSTAYKQITVKKASAAISYSEILEMSGDITQMTQDQVDLLAQLLVNMQSDLQSPTLENIPFVVSSFATASLDGYLFPTCQDYPKFCNDRGYCYQLKTFLYCKCKEGYVGDNCQISKDNSDKLQSMRNQIIDLMYSKLLDNATTTDFGKSIQTAKDILYTELKVNNSQIKSLVKMVELVLSKDQIGTEMNENLKLAENLLEMIMITFNYFLEQNFKERYANFEIWVKSEFTINVGELDYSQVKYEIEYYNLMQLNETAHNLRRLQQTFNKSLLSDPNNISVIKIDNESIPLLGLTRDQKGNLTKMFNKVKDNLEALGTRKIKDSSSELEYEYSSKELNLIVRKIPNLQEFDFIEYFTNASGLNKTNTYGSFFDAKSCINEFLQTKNNSDPLGFLFIEYRYLPRQYDNEFYKNAISDVHIIELMNSNGENIEFTCSKGNEIKHYLPLLPMQNFEFFKYYSSDPTKFNQTNQMKRNTIYPPYYIHLNGSIDHSPFDAQMEKYYNKYNIQLKKYINDSVGYLNEDEGLVYLNQVRYLVASSNTFGEFGGFSESNEAVTFDKNFYYLYYPQILNCGENYIHNICFYIVVILFGLFLLSLFFIIGRQYFKGKKNREIINEEARTTEEFLAKLEQELTLIEQDNERAGENRYSFLFPDTLGNSKGKLQEAKIDQQLIRKGPEIYIQKEKNQNLYINTQFVKLTKESPPSANKLANPNEEKRDDDKMVLNENKSSGRVFFEDPQQKEFQNYFPQINRIETEEVLVETPEKKTEEINMFLSSKQMTQSISHIVNRPVSKKNKISILFYFIFARNIYTNIFTVNSPFTPRQLFISKFMLLIYLLLSLVTIMLVFIDYNLQNSLSFDTGKFAGYIVFSVFASNILYLILCWCFTAGKNTREKFIYFLKNNKSLVDHEKNELRKLM